MPSEQDLFAEEQTMVTMSFGEHIEELRVRLILALAGLMVGVVLAFIPYLDLGKRVMKSMEAPAETALEHFYRNEYDKKAKLRGTGQEGLAHTRGDRCPRTHSRQPSRKSPRTWSCRLPMSSRARP